MKTIIYLLMLVGSQLHENEKITCSESFEEESKAPSDEKSVTYFVEKEIKSSVETIIQKKKSKLTKRQTTSNKKVLKLKEKQPRYFYKDFSLLKCLLAILGILLGIQLIFWIYRISIS